MNVEHRTSNCEHRTAKGGFSLMEVLLAVGTLAVGMLFIAGVFPVGLHWTTVSSERTIAVIVADEAFAKIKLYGITPAQLAAMSYNTQIPFVVPDAEYAYPSTPTTDPNSKRYWWSAICRREPNSLNDVQVTVFISRKVGTGTKYYRRNMISPFALILDLSRPAPVFVSVSVIAGGRPDELQIIDNLPADGIDEKTFINDGYTIVDDATGNIYRVLERYSTLPNTIRLDKNWQGGVLPGKVWVVPPPVGGGRYPCIAVYQKVMRF